MTEQRRTLQPMEVYQDGADFYCAEDGGENDTSRRLWSAPFMVRDFDINAASIAREQFISAMRAKGIEPIF